MSEDRPVRGSAEALKPVLEEAKKQSRTLGMVTRVYFSPEAQKWCVTVLQDFLDGRDYLVVEPDGTLVSVGTDPLLRQAEGEIGI